MGDDPTETLGPWYATEKLLISQIHVFKATVTSHYSKTSGLWQIMLETSPRYQKVGSTYLFPKESIYFLRR